MTDRAMLVLATLIWLSLVATVAAGALIRRREARDVHF